MADLTVVMPVYNALPYLGEACASVLGQSLADFQFLLLDDASTDGSLAYAEGLQEDPRVRVLRCPKQGIAALLNHGLRQVRTRYVAVMHADDVAEPTRLEQQYRFLSAHPDVVLCGCQAVVIDGAGARTGEHVYDTSDLFLRYALLLGSPFVHPGVMYRVEDVLAVGGYDPALVPSEDYDLWCRLAARGRLANLGDALLRYRVHQTNLSVQRREQMVALGATISHRHALATDCARTEEEAAHFRAAALSPPHLVPPAGVEAFGAVVGRFLAAAEARGAGDADLQELRARVRWELLGRAQRCGPFSPNCYRWIRVARGLDPEGMRLARVAGRFFAWLVRSPPPQGLAPRQA